MRRPPLIAILAFGVVALVFVALFQAQLAPPVQGDGHYTWMHGHSLLMDGDFDLRNDYEICEDPWNLGAYRGPDRWPHNVWNVGPAYVWLPFGLYGRWLHGDLPEGDGRFCSNAVSHTAMFGSVIAGLLVWLFSYLLARRYVGVGPAVLGATAIALTSSLPFYSAIIPSYGHASAAFATILFFERWDGTRGRDGLLRWAFIGGLLGFAMLMRSQAALLAAAPLYEWLSMARRAQLDGDRRRLKKLVVRGFVFVLFALAVFLPQMMVWQQTYGTPFAIPQGSGFMRWQHLSVDGVLFAQVNGLFTWTPLVLPGLVGIFIAIKRRRSRVLGVTMLVLIVAYTLVNAAVWDYWAGGSFSARRFTGLMGLFAVGWAFSADAMYQWARVRPRTVAGLTLASVIGACGLWNVASMGIIAKGRVDSAKEHRAPSAWQETFRALSEGVWHRAGNPLSWPASVPWAIAHDAHPRQYDVMRGRVIFYQEYNSRRVRPGLDVDRAEFAEGLGWLYLAEGFEEEPREVDGRDAFVVAEDKARVVIPLFADEVANIEITWRTAPPLADEVDGDEDDAENDAEEEPEDATDIPIAVWLNDAPLGHHQVTSRWVVTRFDVQEGAVRAGTNHIVFEPGDAPIAIQSVRFVQQLPMSRLRRRKAGP